MDLELPDLLTVQEVAKILRISESTVRRWVRNGILTASSIGGPKQHYRFERRTLREMIKPANRNQLQA